jgi:hypothetical protein
MQPSDENPQGNVLTEEEQALIKMNDLTELRTKKTRNKRPNWKMKIVPRHLNRTEKDPVNKSMKLTT